MKYAFSKCTEKHNHSNSVLISASYKSTSKSHRGSVTDDGVLVFRGGGVFVFLLCILAVLLFLGGFVGRSSVGGCRTLILVRGWFRGFRGLTLGVEEGLRMLQHLSPLLGLLVHEGRGPGRGLLPWRPPLLLRRLLLLLAEHQIEASSGGLLLLRLLLLLQSAKDIAVGRAQAQGVAPHEQLRLEDLVQGGGHAAQAESRGPSIVVSRGGLLALVAGLVAARLLPGGAPSPRAVGTAVSRVLRRLLGLAAEAERSHEASAAAQRVG